MGLEFVDRIAIGIGGSERAVRIAKDNQRSLESECLAVSVSTIDAPNEHTREVQVEVDKVLLAIANPDEFRQEQPRCRPPRYVHAKIGSTIPDVVGVALTTYEVWTSERRCWACFTSPRLRGQGSLPR